MTEAIFLGAGARAGDRQSHRAEAKRLLEARGVKVRRVSSLYETEPIGLAGERTLLNAAVEVASSCEPGELLRLCLDVEEELGRRRVAREPGRRGAPDAPDSHDALDAPDEGPRPIDLDLLLWGARQIRLSGLTLPHPRMHLRRFVLVPLAEIAPHAVHPALGADVATMLSRCEDRGRVALWKPPSAWWSGGDASR